MINYRANQVLGQDPLVSGDQEIGRRALMYSFAPKQAHSFDPPSSDYQAAIMTQVAAWPFAADDAGVSFPGGLVAVRTRCWGVNGGGEKDWWTAVPSALPGGYAAVGRTGRVVPLVQDFLGPSPFQGVVDASNFDMSKAVFWRTPDGIAPWPNGSRWTPMNQNQRVYKVPSMSFWYYEATPAPHGTYWYVHTIGNSATGVERFSHGHIGFRGGRLQATAAVLSVGQSAAPAGTMTWMFGSSPTATPATIADITIDWTLDATTAVGDYPIGASLAPSLGTRTYFHVIQKAIFEPWPANASSVVAMPWLSPRVDVPLWYFASAGNQVAPGGVVT